MNPEAERLLSLATSQAKRVERETRILKQLIAQARETLQPEGTSEHQEGQLSR